LGYDRVNEIEGVPALKEELRRRALKRMAGIFRVESEILNKDMLMCVNGSHAHVTACLTRTMKDLGEVVMWLSTSV
jgi:hypothetical protein